MKKMSFTKLKNPAMIILLAVYAVSCSSNSVGSSNDALDECLGTSIPFPSKATINACINTGEGISVVFEPGISWSESIKFFSDKYSSGGWTLTREEISPETSGERSGEWSATSQNYDVTIIVTAFGDSGTGFMVGNLGVFPK